VLDEISRPPLAAYYFSAQMPEATKLEMFHDVIDPSRPVPETD
jgi:hypothetical protein